MLSIDELTYGEREGLPLSDDQEQDDPEFVEMMAEIDAIERIRDQRRS